MAHVHAVWSHDCMHVSVGTPLGTFDTQLTERQCRKAGLGNMATLTPAEIAIDDTRQLACAMVQHMPDDQSCMPTRRWTFQT